MAFIGALLLVVAPAALRAQADVIRGRIINEKDEPVARATVTATSTSGIVARTATTDADGRFTITFPNGDGDYWVDVALIGYAAHRLQVRRVADQDILVADARLTRTGVQLDAMKITAPRRRADVDTTSGDIGGSDRRINTELLTSDQLNDLALLAAMLPGVQIIPNSDGGPSGFSVLGIGADQNLTTLNGMPFNGTALPRDAAFDASVVTSPYDVSHGGFSGAQLALRSRPPTNLTLRANSLAFDAPWLQWTDPAGRALGQDFGSVSIGGVLTTPIQRDRAFAHVAYQANRRYSSLTTLLDANAVGLRAAGLAADSVNRLLSVLNGFGLPASVSRVPSQRLSEQGLLYGSLDFMSPTAPSGRAFNVTFTGNWNRQLPAGLGTTSLPSHGGERQTWQGLVQGRHTTYFGFGVLSETQLSLATSGSDGSRYLDVPSGVVRINSQFADGTQSVGNVSFGGSPALDGDRRTNVIAAMNQLSWFSLDNEHRLKLTTELSRESLDERLASNALGTFQFNSLADLQNGTPASFQRQLSPPRHDISHDVGAISLADSYAPVRNLQLNYGLRLDANRFSAAPVNNPIVQEQIGVSNSSVPDNLRLSPRLGFSYVMGNAKQIAITDGAARAPGAMIRGGVGVFQGLPIAASLGPMLDNTGLGNAAQQIACIGVATPTPDWNAYRTNPASIPTACANGTSGTVFASSTPNVSLFARDFSAPRSVRSNVQWTSQILGGRFNSQADVTYSHNLQQAGTVDLNFAPIAYFRLADEANRPVYVPASAIVPATGASAIAASRLSNQFAKVSEVRSDLRSEAKQLTLSLAPAGFQSSLSWSTSYVYSQIRDQAYGFSSTGGDPRTTEWARSGFDSRHQFVYNVGYSLFDVLRLSWSGSIRSGSPYTPLVSGDVNGDASANDRAFVFAPGQMADSASSAAMATLLRDAPNSVRDCLAKHTGTIATRNSCEGPWTSTAALIIGLNPVRWWRSNRVDVLFQVSNPLGAADLLVNGSDHLHGWGQLPAPDPTLYYVRGFDPAANRYHYEVNPRFGSTAPAVSAIRAPVVLTAVFRVDVGPTREKQTLLQQLDRGRRAPGQKMSEAVIKSFYGTGGLFNPIGAILRVADSLQLTGPQADSLTVLNRIYSRQLDAIWTPIAHELAVLPDDYNAGNAYGIYVRGRRRTVDLLAELVPNVRGLLTPAQIRALPGYAVAYLDTRYLATIRSGTAGLGLAYLPGLSAPRNSGGASGGNVIAR